MNPDQALTDFYQALETRHLASLTFQEVRRALQALTQVYVEKRDRMAQGAALDGAGKRAAFALFYGALHFRTTLAIVDALGLADARLSQIIDLGCGTGVCGAAWALACGESPKLLGVDENAWALTEARWTYGHLGLRGETKKLDLGQATLGGEGTAVIAGWAVNEVPDARRDLVLAKLLKAHEAGARVLVIEPIAKRDRPWWPAWEQAVLARGGKANEWRFRVPFPERLRLLDKAAGLSHTELLARTVVL